MCISSRKLLFNWSCWYGTGQQINSTAFNTKISTFLCPSDGLAGSGSVNSGLVALGFFGESNLNNYLGSLGTTTNPNNPTSTGVFAHSTAYGIPSVTDGTSNTIAFSEGLVSDTGQGTKWRDGVATATSSPLGPGLLDANSNIPAIVADLQTCSRLFAAAAEGAINDKGYRWGAGSPGVAYFNTIVPRTRPRTRGAAVGSTAGVAGSNTASTRTPAACTPAAST